jgi:hypothetical protein
VILFYSEPWLSLAPTQLDFSLRVDLESSHGNTTLEYSLRISLSRHDSLYIYHNTDLGFPCPVHVCMFLHLRCLCTFSAFHVCILQVVLTVFRNLNFLNFCFSFGASKINAEFLNFLVWIILKAKTTDKINYYTFCLENDLSSAHTFYFKSKFIYFPKHFILKII